MGGQTSGRDVVTEAGSGTVVTWNPVPGNHGNGG